MTIKEPESMDECFYFTRRDIDSGNVAAWVFKPMCPKCGKAKLGKPINPKTGKAMIRAKEYTCPECGYTIAKEELEPTLPLNIKYTCPYCGKSGETTTEYRMKKFKGVDACVFECEFCGEKIAITKKMKKLKK